MAYAVCGGPLFFMSRKFKFVKASRRREVIKERREKNQKRRENIKNIELPKNKYFRGK
jgi:hypothetical protein